VKRQKTLLQTLRKKLKMRFRRKDLSESPLRIKLINLMLKRLIKRKKRSQKLKSKLTVHNSRNLSANKMMK